VERLRPRSGEAIPTGFSRPSTCGPERARVRPATRSVLRYSIPEEGIVERIPVPRAARLPQGADCEAQLTFEPINRVFLLSEYRGLRRTGTGPRVQGNVVQFDVGNNVMML
jgi:hypothetical protein